MTLVPPDVRSRLFARSYLSGGLNKISLRIGLDLDRKIYVKMLITLIQILCFQL